MSQFDMRDVTGFLGMIGAATITKAMISDASISRAAITAAEIDKSIRPVAIGDMARLGHSLRHPGKSVIFVTPQTHEMLDRTFGSYTLSEFPFNGPDKGFVIWDEVSKFPTDKLRGMSPDEWRKQFECDFDGEPSKEEIDKEHAKYCREMKRRERAAASRSPSSCPWERF